MHTMHGRLTRSDVEIRLTSTCGRNVQLGMLPCVWLTLPSQPFAASASGCSFHKHDTRKAFPPSLSPLTLSTLSRNPLSSSGYMAGSMVRSIVRSAGLECRAKPRLLQPSEGGGWPAATQFCMFRCAIKSSRQGGVSGVCRVRFRCDDRQRCACTRVIECATSVLQPVCDAMGTLSYPTALEEWLGIDEGCWNRKTSRDVITLKKEGSAGLDWCCMVRSGLWLAPSVAGLCQCSSFVYCASCSSRLNCARSSSARNRRTRTTLLLAWCSGAGSIDRGQGALRLPLMRPTFSSPSIPSIGAGV